MPFDDVEFAQNPDPRCPVVLVVDCSGSMATLRPGDTQSPIEALQEGLMRLHSELSADPLASRRAEVAVVTFGLDVVVASEFQTMATWQIPQLQAAGPTPLGAAVCKALDLIEERKRSYRQNGVSYYRPWLLVITDGVPTDDTTVAAKRIREVEDSKKAACFMVAVDGADITVLQALSARAVMQLQGTKFNELFVWLSASQARVSSSQPGDSVPLPSPSGWAEV